jgi:hypothetical protein
MKGGKNGRDDSEKGKRYWNHLILSAFLSAGGVGRQTAGSMMGQKMDMPGMASVRGIEREEFPRG